MYIKAKVVSKYGTTFEEALSETRNVKYDRKFVLARCISMCVWSHLRKMNSEIYDELSVDSDKSTKESKDELIKDINIIDYFYAYPKFDNRFRYKRINVKGRYVTQEWERKPNGKYVFSGRYKIKRDSNKKLNKTKNINNMT